MKIKAQYMSSDKIKRRGVVKVLMMRGSWRRSEDRGRANARELSASYLNQQREELLSDVPGRAPFLHTHPDMLSQIIGPPKSICFAIHRLHRLPIWSYDVERFPKFHCLFYIHIDCIQNFRENFQNNDCCWSLSVIPRNIGWTNGKLCTNNVNR